MNAIDMLSWVLLAGGSFFCVAGALGLYRLPDFYTRLHGAGVIDTLGAALILLGLMLQAGLSLVAAKLVFIFFMIYLTSPTATHAIAQAAHSRGLEPMLDEKDGETSTASST
ncbi:MAG TPA: monovalent cation/H(+) antiporter subunit G [Acidobacteriota bacterium]|nr:monovalent cation/H(+) antiporter subunit G [Acidobacteriota bacterium]